MDADQIKNFTDLVNAFGAVRTTVYVALGVLAVIAIGGYYLHLRWKAKLASQAAKEEADRQKEKTKRAEKYAAALQNLANSVTANTNVMQNALQQFSSTLQATSMSSSATAQLTTNALVRLDGAISRLVIANNDLSSKLVAKLSARDSLHFITRVFTCEVFHESLRIIRKAIIDNNYEGDAESISTRVRTEIGDVLKRYREYLGAFSALSVRSPDFFELTGDPSVERFTICDELWTITKDYLEAASQDNPREHSNKVAKRVEDAEFVVRNTIADYVRRMSHKLYPQHCDTREIPRVP